MAKAVHMMVRVLDEARSIKFYEACFGLKVSDRKDWPAFTLVYLKNDDNDFEVELTVNKGRTDAYDLGNGYGHIAFVVDDLEATRAKIIAAGYEAERHQGHDARRQTVRHVLLHRRSRRLQDRGPAARRPFPIMFGSQPHGR
jgi:lactoylglutathione lyase